jgi:predicted nucleic acid-binding Zn ribbon protein
MSDDQPDTTGRPRRPRRPGPASRGRGAPDFDRLGDLLPDRAQGAAAASPPAAAMTGVNDELNQRLVAVWPEAVGVEVAANARPAQFRDGRLVVTTSSSAWAHTLQLMAPMVVDKLNGRLGEGAIEKVVFRHAGWDPLQTAPPEQPAIRQRGRGDAAPAPATEQAAPPSPSAFPADPAATSALGPEQAVVPGPTLSESAPAPVPEDLTAEERQALADLDRQPLDPAVKARIREAMRAGFVRARQDSDRS